VRIEIDWSIIRAPIAGVVTRRYVQLGGSVVKNEKLFEVAQLEPLEVKFQSPSFSVVGRYAHLDPTRGLSGRIQRSARRSQQPVRLGGREVRAPNGNRSIFRRRSGRDQFRTGGRRPHHPATTGVDEAWRCGYGGLALNGWTKIQHKGSREQRFKGV